MEPYIFILSFYLVSSQHESINIIDQSSQWCTALLYNQAYRFCHHSNQRKISAALIATSSKSVLDHELKKQNIFTKA